MEKKQITIIPKIQNGNYHRELDVKSDFEQNETIQFICQALNESMYPKNVKQCSQGTLLEIALKVCIFPACNHSKEMEVLSGFNLKSTQTLLVDALFKLSISKINS